MKNGEGITPDEAIRRWIRSVMATEGRNSLFDTLADRFAGMLITEALNLTGGNRSRAAKLLGLSRPTLLSKIEKYHLRVETSVLTDPPIVSD